MPQPFVILLALFAVASTLATWLQPWHDTWAGSRTRQTDLLATLLGDGRRLFADFFFSRADAYFHGGFYPSFFDTPAEEGPTHMAAATSAPAEPAPQGSAATPAHTHEEHPPGQSPEDHDHDHEAELEASWQGRPLDWLDRFSRQFYPSRHVHLELATAKEMLPWLLTTAALDPQRVDTYTVAAYWLRSRLGKVDEAEQFLREGLRANPDSYEILFELARIYEENRQDPRRAHNLYEVALDRWQRRADSREADLIMFRQIVVHLARLEERAGRLAEALAYWEQLQARLPDPGAVQAQIDDLKTRLRAQQSAPR
jgi:tetratricopeptide (TPR) repeat protein